MKSRLAHAAAAGFALAGLVVACGSRSELYALGGYDAEVDATADGADGPADSTTDRPLDARDGSADGDGCPPEAYCDPNDPSHVYQCGKVVATCGLLEQCEVRDGGALCINPCMDTLGNDTSNGCDFYAVELDTTNEATGTCYAVFVVNQWTSGATARLQVSLGDTVLPVDQFARIPSGTGTGITYGAYDSAKGLAKNDIAILFLSRDPNHVGDEGGPSNDPSMLADCPAGVTPAIVGDSALHGTGIATAFRIQANVPVVAYQMLPYGGGRARVTGSTLLLPTSAWSDNYVIADAYKAPTVFIGEDRAGPTTVIVASEDSTHVTVKPTVGIVGSSTVAPTDAGAPVTYTLDHGRYLQFTQPLELTGSAVQSDRPIAVFGGSTLMDIPIDSVRADHGEQMLPPVRALGSEYVAVRYRNRVPTIEETVPWRVVGVVDGTQLTYDPPQSQGPTTLSAGQMVEFDEPGPFVVKSQDASHPFYLATYMTGGCGAVAERDDAGNIVANCPGADNGPLHGFGDPEFMNVVPPAQYLPRYTFFTDTTYPETNLVFVRMRDAQTGTMPDVNLDCAGLLTGWQAVDGADKYEMTRLDLSTGNFQGVGKCNNGVHTVTASFTATVGGRSPTPFFGVTVWGWGNEQTFPTDNFYADGSDETNPKFSRWVSYGYPVGANFKPLNTAVLSAH
ncbi:MAG: IgGFc-binding protein [Polyangiaceae bacterium]